MTYLYDLFTTDDFDGAVDMGYVRLQTHSTEPLTIANYTEICQFERVWNSVTLNCRGLIFNSNTLEIVSRPLPKFFNHDEPNAPVIGLHEAVSVTDKMDGSCGILYQKPSGGRAISTRGSFHSEQAEHATSLLNTKYVSWEPADHLTYIWEIIYPGNRIVCDYGDMDDLVLLGAVGISSGKVYGPNEIPAGELWPGPLTAVFECSSYGEALSMPPREGKEGVVIRTTDGRTVKWKQEDYKALHKLVTGLNARAVWQLMVDGKKIKEILDGIPDEFHDWLREVYLSISAEVHSVISACCQEFDDIMEKLEQDVEAVKDNPKKAFALIAKTSPNKGYLFRLWDGKDIRDEVLKNAKPAADWTPVRVPDEATA